MSPFDNRIDNLSIFMSTIHVLTIARKCAVISLLELEEMCYHVWCQLNFRIQLYLRNTVAVLIL